MVLFSQKLMKLGILVAQRAVTFIRELGLNNSIFYGDSGLLLTQTMSVLLAKIAI